MVARRKRRALPLEVDLLPMLKRMRIMRRPCNGRGVKRVAGNCLPVTHPKRPSIMRVHTPRTRVRSAQTDIAALQNINGMLIRVIMQQQADAAVNAKTIAQLRTVVAAYRTAEMRKEQFANGASSICIVGAC